MEKNKIYDGLILKIKQLEDQSKDNLVLIDSLELNLETKKIDNKNLVSEKNQISSEFLIKIEEQKTLISELNQELDQYKSQIEQGNNQI